MVESPHQRPFIQNWFPRISANERQTKVDMESRPINPNVYSQSCLSLLAWTTFEKVAQTLLALLVADLCQH